MARGFMTYDRTNTIILATREHDGQTDALMVVRTDKWSKMCVIVYGLEWWFPELCPLCRTQLLKKEDGWYSYYCPECDHQFKEFQVEEANITRYDYHGESVFCDIFHAVESWKHLTEGEN